MLKSTHISISVGVSSILLSGLNLFIKLDVLYIFLILMMGVISKIPDWLDHKIGPHKRRYISHSPQSPVLMMICLLCGIAFSFVSIFMGLYISMIIFLIFFLHFFLDALNPSGVPWTRKGDRIILKKIPYDNKKWNIIFFTEGVLMLILGASIFLLT